MSETEPATGTQPLPPAQDPAPAEGAGDAPGEEEDEAEPAPFDPGAIVDGGQITGHFGDDRGDHIHQGTDVDTPLGEEDIEVHCPVSGTVSDVGGNYNKVSVRDEYGYIHEFLHLDSRSVAIGDAINAGDSVGIMGGFGPDGEHQYDTHVHYQIWEPGSDRVDPETDYPHFGDAVDQEEDEGVGDPPVEGDGPGSYGGEAAPGAGGPPPGPPNPTPDPAPAPGPAPVPAPGRAPVPGAAPSATPPVGAIRQISSGSTLLSREVARLSRLQRQAAGAASTSSASEAKKLLWVAAIDLGDRLDLVSMTATEAETLGEELLAQAVASRSRKGDRTEVLEKIVALAMYSGRARAVGLAARGLASRNDALVRKLGGDQHG